MILIDFPSSLIESDNHDTIEQGMIGEDKNRQTKIAPAPNGAL